MRALALTMLLCAACGSDGTGVLIAIRGNLSFDTIAVQSGPLIREDAIAGGQLPTEFLAILPDSDATVSFTVMAKVAGNIVASASTGSIAVVARHITSVGVDLGGVVSPADMGEGGGIVRGGAPPQGATLTGVWGSAATDVYLTSVTQAGVNLLHTNDHGATFTTAGVGNGTPDLLAVSGAGGTVTLVGAQGTVLRGQGTTFVTETTPAGAKTLRGVFALSATEAYAVGDGNTILHRVTGGWILQSMLGTRVLYGVWASDASHVWAVGEGGAIFFSSGNALWTPLASGTTATLRAVHGSGSTVWAVGDGGTIVSSTSGGPFTAQPSGTSQDLYGVFARASEVVAVGSAWTLVRSTGAAFAPLDVGLASGDPATNRWRAVWGTGATERFVVGAGQTVLQTP